MDAIDHVGAICGIVTLSLSILALLFTSPILNWWAKRSAHKALQRIKELEANHAEVLRLKESDSARSLYVQQRFAAILATLSLTVFMALARTEEKATLLLRLYGLIEFLSSLAAMLISAELCISLHRIRYFETYDAETQEAMNQLKTRMPKAGSSVA